MELFKENDYGDKTPTLAFYGLLSFGVIGLIAFAILNPFTIVSSGYVGVPVQFGKVQDYTLPNGFHIVNPMTDVVEVPVSIQRVPVVTQAASSDLQTVAVKATANYRLQTKNVGKLYFDFQKRYEQELIIPSVLESIKSASAKLNAEQLITDRATFRQNIITVANEKLSKYGILLEEISIENIDFSPSFNAAIEAKVTAEQEALTSKNQLEKVKYEAQQTIEKAKAEAESLRIQAESIASSPQIVELEAVKKWDGKLPQYVTNGATPFINLK